MLVGEIGQWPHQSAAKDELHLGLPVPNFAARKIHEWARQQPFPEGTELEHPKDYHVTLLYAPEGGRAHDDAGWLEHLEHGEVNIDGFESSFGSDGKYAYVLLVDSQEIKDHAEKLQQRGKWMGLDISEFKGGYKPHITVAYGPTPHVPGIKAPEFWFGIGPSEVSPRRAESSAPTEPPHYRPKDKPSEHCGNCKMLWRGKCWGYGNKQVDPEYVCNSWAAEKTAHASSPQAFATAIHQRFASNQDGDLVEDTRHLLRAAGYPDDDITTQAMLQAWQQMYPLDKASTLAEPLEPHIQVYHGTTNRALERARQRGVLEPWHPRDVANEVASHYGLNPDEFYDHPYFEFSRDRGRDPNLYVTTNPKVAQHYADSRSEQLEDALNTAHRMLNPDMYNDAAVEGFSGTPDQYHRQILNSAKEEFRNQYHQTHDIQPQVVSINVPHSAIPDDQQAALQYEAQHGLSPETVTGGTYRIPGPIPLDWISPSRSAKVAGETLPQEQRRWSELERLYPPQSITAHEFPDGFTVQRHHSENDVRRVGHFMVNCWKGAQVPNINDAYNNGYVYASLHDPSGLPRVAWYEHQNPWQNNASTEIKQPLGMRNDQLWQFPNSQYTPYLRQYAEHQGYDFKEPREPQPANLDEVPGLRGTMGEPMPAGARTAWWTWDNPDRRPNPMDRAGEGPDWAWTDEDEDSTTPSEVNNPEDNWSAFKSDDAKQHRNLVIDPDQAWNRTG